MSRKSEEIKLLKKLLSGLLDSMGALSDPSELDGMGLEEEERKELEEFIRRNEGRN